MLKKLKGYCCQFGSPSELLLKTVDDLVDGKLGPVENLKLFFVSHTVKKFGNAREKSAFLARLVCSHAPGSASVSYNLMH